ncbi:cell envelope biogenesis protein OmpA [Winogradskyella sp. PC-19]|uniref:OmpA family protein n=1 Tax=unclassified Winogradskyella TaxID=2615021 RepID=UPI000B3D125A|nr:MULTISPECIES: OmpA family protein [unclassified Winogradskyella]ARV09077.1 cell envelope biogenesis protein OmpA [Winogradskyella sp. PC-19]RZN81409.1 MAG: OmpA family protein [Winogradskyella sp.]
MGNLYKIVLVSFLFFSFQNTNAQDEYNPWAISVGFNAVDYFPVGQPDPQGDLFDEFFNVNDHWNIFPMLTKIEVSKYWKNRISFSASASFNRIKKFGTNINPSSGKEENNIVDNLAYYALDGSINYSFTDATINNLEPYIGAGGGYTWLNSIGSGTLNGSLGLRYWFSEKVAFNLQSTYKHVFEVYGFRHFQHTASVVYKFGGKKDTDRDGISDDIDACPEKPGLLKYNGCPDTDEDGISDPNDNCPKTPGLEALNGCPDADNDGITDRNDKCPNTAGLAALNGCPDADNDGITDQQDKCPEIAGPFKNYGCPWPDTDGDGVPDKDDKCPTETGTLANGGCKEFTREEENLINQYARVILFNPGRTDIKEESKNILQDIITIMKNNSTARFYINGYTDSVGPASQNLKLSEERAIAVKNYLVINGINPNRLRSQGFGEENPIATNMVIEGRRKNRRVEIILAK